jgi:hypothetical protein
MPFRPKDLMLAGLRSRPVQICVVFWLLQGCAQDVDSDGQAVSGCGGVQLRNYNSNEIDNQPSGGANDSDASFLDGTTRVVFSMRLDALQAGEVLAITSDFDVTDRYDLHGPYSYDYVDHGGPQMVGVQTAIVLASSPTAVTGTTISASVAKEISYNLHHGEIAKGSVYTVSSADASGGPRFVNVIARAVCWNDTTVPCSPAEGAENYFVRVDSLGTMEVRRFAGIGSSTGTGVAGAVSAPLSTGTIELPIQPMSACNAVSPPYKVISSVALGNVSAGEIVEGFTEAGLQLVSSHRARILGKIIVAPSPTSSAGFDVSAETFTQLPSAYTYGTFFKTGSRAAPYAQAGAYLNAVLVACEDSPDGVVNVQAGTAHVQGLYGVPQATPSSIAPSGSIGANAFGPNNVVTAASAGSWSFYGDGSVVPEPAAAQSHGGYAAGLWSNGMVSTTLYASTFYDVLNVSAAGEYCSANYFGYGWENSTEGSPAFNVFIDGKFAGSRTITEEGEYTQTYANGTWYAPTHFTDHFFPVDIGPGTHTVSVQFFNDYRGTFQHPAYLCDRNLLVDMIGFGSRQAPTANVIGVGQQETRALATATLALDGNWHTVYALDLGPLTSANIGEVIAVSAEYQVGAGTTTNFSNWTGGNIPEVTDELLLNDTTAPDGLTLAGALGDNIDLVIYEQGRTRVATHTITDSDVSHQRRYVILRAVASDDGSLPEGFINVGNGKLAVLRYPRAGASAAN